MRSITVAFPARFIPAAKLPLETIVCSHLLVSQLEEFHATSSLMACSALAALAAALAAAFAAASTSSAAIATAASAASSAAHDPRAASAAATAIAFDLSAPNNQAFAH